MVMSLLVGLGFVLVAFVGRAAYCNALSADTETANSGENLSALVYPGTGAAIPAGRAWLGSARDGDY